MSPSRASSLLQGSARSSWTTTSFRSSSRKPRISSKAPAIPCNAGCSDPQNAAPLSSLQRDLHTLKGGARMAEVEPVGDLAHELESLYEGLVDRRYSHSEGLAQLLQQSHDRLAQLLEQLQDHQAAGRSRGPDRSDSRVQAGPRGQRRGARSGAPATTRPTMTASCWTSSLRKVSTSSKAPVRRCCAGRPSRRTARKWKPCCATCTPSRAVRAWWKSPRSAIWPMSWSFSTKVCPPACCNPRRRCSSCCSAAMTGWRRCSTRRAPVSRCRRPTG